MDSLSGDLVLLVFTIVANGYLLVYLWVLIRIERMGIAKRRFNLWFPKYVLGIVLSVFLTAFWLGCFKQVGEYNAVTKSFCFLFGTGFALGNFVKWKAIELGLDIGTGGLKSLSRLLNKLD